MVFDGLAMCEVSLGDGTGDPCGAALGGHVEYALGRFGRWKNRFLDLPGLGQPNDY